MSAGCLCDALGLHGRMCPSPNVRRGVLFSALCVPAHLLHTAYPALRCPALAPASPPPHPTPPCLALPCPLQPFGPVLPIVRVASVEAAVAHVNANRLALQGCVFTRDVNKAMYISDAMETGSVQVGSLSFGLFELSCGWGEGHMYIYDAMETGSVQVGGFSAELWVGKGRVWGKRGNVRL